MLSRGSFVRITLRCSRWPGCGALSLRYLAAKDTQDDPAERHRLFLEQMNELNAEQSSLFGSAPGDDPNLNQQFQNHDATKNEDNVATSPSKEDIEQLKQDREQLYGFTEQEQVAWGSSGSNKQLDPSFLGEIARKRQEHFNKLDQNEQKILQESLQSHKRSDTIQPESSDSLKSGLTHVSADGSSLHMVDVGTKALTTRIATAETIVRFPPSVVTALQESNNTMPKGPVFSTAITAGIMAAKQTSNLIPLCHPLFLSKVNITIDWMDCQSAVRVECQCKVTDSPTGVEMEALTGCSVAALTIYDMVKAVSHDIVLSSTRLIHKEGGKRHFDIRTSRI